MRKKVVDTIIPVKFNSSLSPADVEMFKSKLAELGKDLDIEISVLLQPEDKIGARIVCHVCGEDVEPSFICMNCLNIFGKERSKELRRKKKEEKLKAKGMDKQE